MTEIRLIISISWIFQAVTANTPMIRLIPSESNFIEDKPTTFTCKGSSGYARVTWMIRDPGTGLNTFIYSNSSLSWQTKPQSLSPGQWSNFTVIMRRDLSKMEVVCRNEKMETTLDATFSIPVINKTNSIEEVRLTNRHQVRGKSMNLFCDVKDPEKVVKKVFVRFPNRLQPLESRAIVNGWIRFYWMYQYRAKMHHNSPIQCFVTTNEKENFGNVMSPITTRVVHYLEFSKPTLQNSKRKIQNSSTEITLGHSLSLSLDVNAYPQPSLSEFSIISADGKTDVDRNWTTVENITKMNISHYNVLLHFAAKKSGKFKVLFESKERHVGAYAILPNSVAIFSNSSDSFTVQVFSPHFVFQYSKKLPKQKPFMEKFILYTRPEPRQDQLQMLFSSEKDPKTTSEVAKDTQIFKIKDNLYQVELTVNNPQNGTYIPVLRSGSVDVFGPEVKITI